MKVGIVGRGFVGSSAAYALTLGGVVNEIVLIDRNTNLARSQAEDLLHSTPFFAPSGSWPANTPNSKDLNL